MKEMLMNSKKIAAAAAFGLGVTLFVSPAANAAAQDGVTHRSEFVFYYNSGWKGSLSDFKSSKANLAGYNFLSNGNGKGQAVKNNSASVANFHSSRNARVYYNSNYAGANDLVPKYTKIQLTNTYNDNASYKWL